jgi:phospholipase C
MPDQRNSTNVAEDYGQTGIRIPGVAISPYTRRNHVSHMTCTPVSILKMISYRFGLAPLNRRLAYSPNIARSFDWESKPRLGQPGLPTPVHVVGQQCPARSASILSAQQPTGAPPRPKEHDLAVLRDSGYLERLGFKFRPATAESTFRHPSKVAAAHRAASR